MFKFNKLDMFNRMLWVYALKSGDLYFGGIRILNYVPIVSPGLRYPPQLVPPYLSSGYRLGN